VCVCVLCVCVCVCVCVCYMCVSNEISHLTQAFQIDVDNVDVFCEKGVFELEDTRRILTAATAAGLRANFHGEELSYLGCVFGATAGMELKDNQAHARAYEHIKTRPRTQTDT
jgi:imidazolonepropionase